MDDFNSSLDFELELDTSSFKQAINDADRLAKNFSRSLSGAFVGVAAKGQSLSNVVSSIGLQLSRLVLDIAFKPLENGLTNLLSPLAGGLSGLFSSPQQAVTPFAKGGVVSAPTFFSSGGSLGLAGERGSEAILPLARDSNGSLGVRMHGQNSASNVTINIATPDVDGFRRSQSEISASLARMVSRGQRGL